MSDEPIEEGYNLSIERIEDSWAGTLKQRSGTRVFTGATKKEVERQLDEALGSPPDTSMFDLVKMPRVRLAPAGPNTDAFYQYDLKQLDSGEWHAWIRRAEKLEFTGATKDDAIAWLDSVLYPNGEMTIADTIAIENRSFAQDQSA